MSVSRYINVGYTIIFFAIFLLETVAARSALDLEFEASHPFLIKGTRAAPGQFPFIAFICSPGFQYGAGVLISTRHLLAKADLLVNWDNVTVILGAHQLNLEESSQQKFFVDHEHIIFPEEIVSGFDLAIIPLPNAVELNERVQPVLLPRRSDKGVNYIGTNGLVVGNVEDIGRQQNCALLRRW